MTSDSFLDAITAARVVTYQFPIKGKNLSQALPLKRHEFLA